MYYVVRYVVLQSAADWLIGEQQNQIIIWKRRAYYTWAFMQVLFIFWNSRVFAWAPTEFFICVTDNNGGNGNDYDPKVICAKLTTRSARRKIMIENR